MTKEITPHEALDEINRLNRERDAIRAQLAEAERVIEFKDKVITAIETRAEAAEARTEEERNRGQYHAGRADRAARLRAAAEARADAAEGRKRMKKLGEIKAAYITFRRAAEKIPEKEFTDADMLRIEGALDALNWVLNNDELASIFETTLKGLRNRLAREGGGE